MGDDVQRAAEGPLEAGQRRRRSGGVPEIFHEAGALHGGNGDPLRAVDRLPASRPISISPKASRSACAFIRRRSSASPTRSRCTSAMSSRRTAAGGSSPSPTRKTRPPHHRACSALCAFLAASPHSPVRKHTPQGADIDSVIDVRAIFQQGHRELAIEAMPPFLLPRKGRYGLIDYEKMFCPDLKNGADIFDLRGIDRKRGCMVVVRPGPVCRARPAARRLRRARRPSSAASCWKRESGAILFRGSLARNPTSPPCCRGLRPNLRPRALEKAPPTRRSWTGPKTPPPSGATRCAGVSNEPPPIDVLRQGALLKRARVPATSGSRAGSARATATPPCELIEPQAQTTA